MVDKTLAEAVRHVYAPGKYPGSEKLSFEISRLIPGGVNSPFRSYHEVGGHALFIARGKGSKVFDVDGNEFIDYLGAWGPAILGHCPPDVVRACQETLSYGPVLGAPHETELELARLLSSMVPSCQKVRFVNSGTEAVMSAIRLARGFTGRDLLVTFEGCYHGHADAVLASENNSASEGIPESVAQNTLAVPFNDFQALQAVMESKGSEIAAVLIEPVAGSMGVVPPRPGYLDLMRELCSQHGSLLIFDEVLTGFRVHQGGAQALYGVEPDLTCFGKALAGGMPVGAFGGRSDIMDCLSPVGNVYQAGTFSGNPVTMTGGIATLKLLACPSVYETLESRCRQLYDGLEKVIFDQKLPVTIQGVGGMFSILFCREPVTSYRDSLSIDEKAFARFFHAMLERGIYLPPTAVDAAAISSAHSRGDIAVTIDAFESAFKG